MIFDQETVLRKSAALDRFFTRTLKSIIDDLTGVFGNVQNVQLLPRPWYPGGGAILFMAIIDGVEAVVKIKDKTLGVGSRLECEPTFPTPKSLANEAAFCFLLAKEPHVPTLRAYLEDDEYAYECFERLSPFEQGITALSSHERLEAFKQIEALLSRLYQQCIVHGDVHEKNILFRGKQAVLCDFEEARLLQQDLPFEQSLDVAGENQYGRLGQFPAEHGLVGRTCLNRLRQVFARLT